MDIKCICEFCRKEFFKTTGEYNRKVRKGSKFYCSRTCSASAFTPGRIARLTSKDNLAILASWAGKGKKKDQFSGIRKLHSTIKGRCLRSGKEFNLTLSYLLELWISQEGKCSYLKTDLVLPSTDYSHDNSNPNKLASLDRIDSSKGYVEGNVQFIALTLNYSKNKYSEEIMLELFEMIKQA